MEWNILDSDNTFRLVFTDYQTPNNFNYIEPISEIVQWHNYQQLPNPDLYVIKLGYSNFFPNKKIPLELFEKNIFNNVPVRFSVYQKINQITDFSIFQQYEKISYNNIYFTVCWIYEPNTDINLLIQYLSNKTQLNHVFLFHNCTKETILNAYTLLKPYISGYDITGDINNLDNNIFYKKKLIDTAMHLKKNNLEFLQKIMPEFNNLLNPKELNQFQTFQEQIQEFTKNGFLIDTQKLTISPLIYGAADDFSMPSQLTIQQFLLMTYPDVNNYFQKSWTKIFLNSHCSQCDKLEQCQKIYWLNIHNSNECGLNIDNL